MGDSNPFARTANYTERPEDTVRRFAIQIEQLKEQLAEAHKQIAKITEDTLTDADKIPRGDAEIGGGWGLPDLAENGDCTLYGAHVIGYDDRQCTCGAGGELGHEHYCGWAPFAKPVPWLKKLAPNVKFILGQVEGTEFLNTWDGQLFDMPSDPVARKDLLEAKDHGGKFAMYALIRIPDEVVSRDDS